MRRFLKIVPLLALFVLMVDSVPHSAIAADVIDFFWLRDTILAENQVKKSNRSEVDASDLIGTWVRWHGQVTRVMAPQDGLWLILVEMDPPGEASASHDLEVWTDDPAAVSLTPGQDITVKGSIADYRRLPGSVVHIVIDARG